MKKLKAIGKYQILFLIFVLIFSSTFNSVQYLSAKDDKLVSSKEMMVTTAHPLATQAAIEILKKGGNAVDAAVAAAFAVGVVEPDGSGLGGGGGMVVYMKKLNKVFYINYYQRAPENVLKMSYTNANDGKTPKAVLVPGTVAGLTLAVEKFGTLPLSVILEPAIRYAEEGFPIDETLSKIILDNLPLLEKYPKTSSIYLRDEFPLSMGETLTQPDLANTLKIIAQKGRKGFYEGEVAETIVREVRENGGILTLNDLNNYHAELTSPVFGTYRGYEIYSANVPQAGVSVIQAMNMLENENLGRLGRYDTSATTLHIMAETFRRVYADRTSFVEDRKFGHVPVNGLISKSFAKSRYEDINRYIAEPREYRKTKAGNPLAYDTKTERQSSDTDTETQERTYYWDDNDDDGTASYGKQDDDPFGKWGLRKNKLKKSSEKQSDKKETEKQEKSVDPDQEFDGHTTHLCVVDKEGNMVSLTQTLGTFFGSGFTTAGVLLNCSMTNFSVVGTVNHAEPNKQPRSSIAPTIILKDGEPFLAVGSPGATRIVATVAELISNIIDFGMDAEEANNFPRFFCQKNDDYLHIESRISQSVQNELEKKGHRLRVYGDLDLFFGGAQIILVDKKKGLYYGSADPRRGGKAVGDYNEL